jgi:hypothetical protein
MNALITILTVSCLLFHSFAAAADKPNIIFVITDDQGYGDISAHGNPILKTPHLDQLRSESVRFEDFHVSPTCAPTRSALFSGRHEFKNGVTHTKLVTDLKHWGIERDTIVIRTDHKESSAYVAGNIRKRACGRRASARVVMAWLQ